MVFRILLPFLCVLLFLIIYGFWGRIRGETVTVAPTDGENIIERVRESMEELLLEDTVSNRYRADETEKREEQRAVLRLAIKNAPLGDASMREYVKDTIREVLTEQIKVTEQNICRIIPFDDSRRLSAKMKFELLYVLACREYVFSVFSHMAEKFGWGTGGSREISEADIENAYDTYRVSTGFNDYLEVLTQYCYEQIYGHDCVDILIMDDSLDGISAGCGGSTRVSYNYLEELFADECCERDKTKNSFDTVYIVFHGRLIRMSFLGFGSEAALKRVVKNIYRYNSGTVLSRKNPVVLGTFGNNSRILVARPPVADGWMFFLRSFNNQIARDMRSLIINEGGDTVIRLLEIITRAEFNFVISGNTGGGKTTLLKAMVGAINPAFTIRVAESSFELNLNNLYPDRNIVVLQERGDFSIYDAITATKKMDTDVILIGEVNEPKLAGAYIQVAQSGSRMAVTTLHHKSTEAVVDYLRNALVSEFGISDVRMAQEQVIDVLNFDIHMVHDTEGNHYVERITEVVPLKNEEQSSMDNRHLYVCRDIIYFDSVKNRYVSRDALSKRSIERILGCMGASEATAFLDELMAGSFAGPDCCPIGEYIDERNGSEDNCLEKLLINPL